MSDPSPDAATRLTRRDGERAFDRSAGASYDFRLRRLVAHMLEVEDVHFNHDSAVLLADYRDTAKSDDDASADAQDDALESRITGLGVIAAFFRHVDRNRAQKVLVTGHTDRSGSEDYNLKLSKQRADNVLHLITGARAKWIDSCNAKHKIEDQQQILKWLADDWGWDCDPGPINNQSNSQTKTATKRFQETYNQEFSAAIAEDGDLGKQTWGAFFDIYTKELVEILAPAGIDEAGLAFLQGEIAFLDDGQKSVGCGESFPITDQNRSRVDRRVELLFFDPDEEPSKVGPLRCHPSASQCLKDECEIRNRVVFDIIPLPVPPVLPRRLRMSVHLSIGWKDPRDPATLRRPFAKGTPVKVEFGDGSAPLELQLAEDGLLSFQMSRRKPSLSLAFDVGERRYVASMFGELPSSATEQLLAEADVPQALRQGKRIFFLPQRFSTGDTDWSVTHANWVNTHFENFASSASIGAVGTPVPVTLDPHWQYLKLLYFDRKLKKKLSLPPLVLDGFASAAAATGAPDTRSNWITDTEACQCLPWVLRRNPDGSELGTPNGNVLIQARTAATTYVDSSSEPRKLVTKRAAGAAGAADVGLNDGEATAFDMNKPSAGRLAFYDLPRTWKSRAWFVRLAGAPAKSGRFESLAAEATSDARPLLFSLDDMVLTDPSLRLLGWTPTAGVMDRVALLCNTFTSGPNLSNIGLHKADAAGNRTYFTQLPAHQGNQRAELDRNYIADYPDWTRLVVARGNLFDVFDKRVEDEPNGVVGARAAVRWIDLTAAGNFVRHKGGGAGNGQLPSRPPLRTNPSGPFFAVQPFYEQRHDAWWTSSDSDDRGTGRYDMTLLRCCDVTPDGQTEVATALSYFRFFFDQNAGFTPSFNPNGTPLGLGAAAAQQWSDTAIANLLRRWNGPDGVNNPGPAQVEPKDPAAEKHHVRCIWFAQDLPSAVAHYQIGVFQDATSPGGVRGYMASGDGQGALDQSDNTVQASGWFTFAHETGHGGSLHDEYVEPTTRTNLPQPWMPGFDSFSPGSPFYEDQRTIMNGNQRVDARDFWHVAEWIRSLGGNRVDYEVVHGPDRYSIAHHAQAPSRTHIAFPLRMARNQTKGTHGKFDAFLYPLGRDGYSRGVLGVRARAPVDGIVVILVKMEFDYDIGGHVSIHAHLSGLDQQIHTKFNAKFFASGSFDGVPYQRALLYFAPRYRVKNSGTNYSSKDPEDTSEHIQVKINATGPTEWDSGLFSDDHEVHFARNQPASAFARFFGEMIGAAPAALDTPASYQDIVRGVFPGATVHSVR